MVLEIKKKTIPSFEREDHIESKKIRNEIWFFLMPKKGAKPKN